MVSSTSRTRYTPHDGDRWLVAFCAQTWASLTSIDPAIRSEDALAPGVPLHALIAQVLGEEGQAAHEAPVNRMPGSVVLAAASAGDAHRMAESVLRAAERQDDTGHAPPPLRVGIAVEKPSSGGEVARQLASVAAVGEICIGNWGYDELPAEIQRGYGRPERLHVYEHGVPVEFIVYRTVIGGRRAAEARPVTRDWCALNVDMSRFTRTVRHLSESGWSGAYDTIQEQVRDLVKGALRAANASAEICNEDWKGDGALLLFETVEQAVLVGQRLLESAHERNEPRGTDNHFALRCFRVGIDYGTLKRTHNRWAGEALITSVRLEAAGPCGEIRISPEAYQKLPTNMRMHFGAEEQRGVVGKDGPWRMRRWRVRPHAPWDTDIAPPPPNPEFPQTAPAPPEIGQCFVISAIDTDDERLANVMQELIVPACSKAGLQAQVADQLSGANRWQTITQALADAPMVVAYLGAASADGTFNSNVMIEVGYRLATDKPLVLLREQSPGAAPAVLPFDLRNRNVIPVTEDPGQTVEKVVAEIKSESRGTVRWTWPYPYVEAKMLPHDALFTCVSDKARDLFGQFMIEGTSVSSMIEALRRMMTPAQYQAMISERQDFIKQIYVHDADLWSRKMFGAQPIKLPMLQVPMCFKRDDPHVPAKLQGRAFLPVMVGYRLAGDERHARTVYIEVTHALRRSPEGYDYAPLGEVAPPDPVPVIEPLADSMVR